MDNTPQNNNEKLQEFSIVVTDRFRNVGRGWWYALGISIVLCIPLFYGLRLEFANLIVKNHNFPAYIYQDEAKMPLEVAEKKVFDLGGGSFGGYVKIRNSANYDWGVPNQSYTAIFYTTGGTEVTRVNGSTYILPSSEKIIVFPRFLGDGKVPTQIDFQLGPTQFVRKPARQLPDLAVERTDPSIVDSKLILKSSVKNNTPFKISKIDLPVLLYDNHNQVVGALSTNINSVLPGESRSFQYAWPNNPAYTRPEILPQVNIFDNNIYQ